MRKAGQDDVWEIRFLLYSLPLIMETITFLNLMRTRGSLPTSLFKPEDVKERVVFYKLITKVENMLDLLEAFINNRMACNISTTRAYGKVVTKR